MNSFEIIAFTCFTLFTLCLLWLTIWVTIVGYEVLKLLRRFLEVEETIPDETHQPAAAVLPSEGEAWGDQEWAAEPRVAPVGIRVKATEEMPFGSGRIILPDEWDMDLQQPPVTVREENQ